MCSSARTSCTERNAISAYTVKRSESYLSGASIVLNLECGKTYYAAIADTKSGIPQQLIATRCMEKHAVCRDCHPSAWNRRAVLSHCQPRAPWI